MFKWRRGLLVALPGQRIRSMSIADSGSPPLIHTFGQAELCYQFKGNAIGGHVFKGNAMEGLALPCATQSRAEHLRNRALVTGQSNQGRRRAFPSA